MNIKDVENLAELSRLDLSNDEKETLLEDLDSILEYVQIVEKTSVDNINSVHDLYNVWREDELSERDFSKELLVEQFPDSQDGFLKVKKIL